MIVEQTTGIIADEDKIELSALTRQSYRFEHLKIFTALGCARMSPAGNVIACAHGVNTQMHLPAWRHRLNDTGSYTSCRRFPRCVEVSCIAVQVP